MPGRGEERFAAAMALTLPGGKGETRNVSASGVYFVTDVRLHAGSALTFEVAFPDVAGGPARIRCIGRVVRVDVLERGMGVGAAIDEFELVRP
jgi:hypothetical protein